MKERRTILLSLVATFAFLGALVALVNVSKSSTAATTSRFLRKGPLNADGPWPECLGLTGDDCAELIRYNAPDCSVRIFQPKEFANDHKSQRVGIYVDKQGFVVEMPVRG